MLGVGAATPSADAHLPLPHSILVIIDVYSCYLGSSS